MKAYKSFYSFSLVIGTKNIGCAVVNPRLQCVGGGGLSGGGKLPIDGSRVRFLRWPGYTWAYVGLLFRPVPSGVTRHPEMGGTRFVGEGGTGSCLLYVFSILQVLYVGEPDQYRGMFPFCAPLPVVTRLFPP